MSLPTLPSSPLHISIPQFDAEIDEQIETEKSRIVKIFMLKYKCILIFTFMLLCILQFAYIIAKLLLEDEEIKTILISLANAGNEKNINYTQHP
jgi:hypothetical protein